MNTKKKQLIGASVAIVAVFGLTACASNTESTTEPTAVVTETITEETVTPATEMPLGETVTPSTQEAPQPIIQTELPPASEENTQTYIYELEVGNVFLAPYPNGLNFDQDKPIPPQNNLNSNEKVVTTILATEIIEIDIEDVKTPDGNVKGAAEYKAIAVGSATITNSFEDANGEIISAVTIVTVK